MSDTGGPAFPVVIDMGLTVDWSKGMTLRDYFAAKFMTKAQSLCEHSGEWSMETAAQCAYAMADAMLKARDQ